MVERQIDAQITDLKADLSREKISWQDYLLLSKQSEADVRATLRELALKTLRSYLVLREVARAEGIQVEPEEVDAEIEATASQFGAAANVVRERLNTRDQRERIEVPAVLSKGGPAPRRHRDATARRRARKT